MQRNRHHAAGLRALAVEHVEGAADHLLELVGGEQEALVGRLVVGLLRVGYRDQPAPAVEVHDVGLIVVAPVADVFATLRRQQVERVPGLLQAGAKPPLGRRAGRPRDGLEGALDDLRLLAGRRLVEAARVALVVAHPLPLPLLALLDDDRMAVAEVAVERDRAADAVAVEHLHQAPHADAVAVVAVGPHHHVRHLAAGAVAAGALLQREELDVGDHPQREALPLGPGQAGTIDDRRVLERAIVARFHLSWLSAP
jgi:hypothetical protein